MRSKLHHIILAGLVCAAMPILCAGENIARNPGFEDPAGEEGNMPAFWSSFCSDRPGLIRNITTSSREGERCVLMIAQGKMDAYEGLIQRLPIKGGATYDFIIHVRRNKDNPLGGGACGRMVIEWLNGNGLEVAREEGKQWAHELSAFRWDKIAMEGVPAPLDAKEAVFGIHLLDGPEDGRGSFFVDDVTICEHEFGKK